MTTRYQIPDARSPPVPVLVQENILTAIFFLRSNKNSVKPSVREQLSVTHECCAILYYYQSIHYYLHQNRLILRVHSSFSCKLCPLIATRLHPYFAFCVFTLTPSTYKLLTKFIRSQSMIFPCVTPVTYPHISITI